MNSDKFAEELNKWIAIQRDQKSSDLDIFKGFLEVMSGGIEPENPVTYLSPSTLIYIQRYLDRMFSVFFELFCKTEGINVKYIVNPSNTINLIFSKRGLNEYYQNWFEFQEYHVTVFDYETKELVDRFISILLTYCRMVRYLVKEQSSPNQERIIKTWGD